LAGVTLIAGIVALAGGSDVALATLTGAMVALWALATFRHSMSRTTPEVIRVRPSVASGDRSGLPPHT
jgi:hypothetical protein